MVNLDDKFVLITGGTGSIGKELLFKILKDYSPKIVRIFSRDETKQFELSKKLRAHDLQLRYLIGDIRDKDRLDRAMENIDVVFHLAAMKHVTACEYNPFEAIKTNIIGVQNLIDVSLAHDIENLVYTSTDKAATPCNTMGVTKLLGEKLVTTANFYKGQARTVFHSVRFGNVIGTRGSLIPLIIKQIKNNLPITLTHYDMTRYILSIEESINFLLNSLNICQGGEVFVPKMKCIKIIDLIKVLIEIFAKKYNKKAEKIQIEKIGMFSGEKLYEELFSIEEAERTYELNDQYIIFPQMTEITKEKDLKKYPNIKQFDINKPSKSNQGPFLTKEEIKEFLIQNNIF